MKKLTLCLIVVLISIGPASIAVGLRDVNKGSPPGGPLPELVCRAIEQYIADVDAARSISDQGRRKAKCASAQAQLEAVLKKNNRTALLAEITPYARFSEMVTVADSTDPKLGEMLAERLKIRTKLLEWCTSYTLDR